MRDSIFVRGARAHNLKNISVELPRNKFIVITGISGSGKSTLAFDTIYAEGQRRYVESLSAYARQFIGLMDKPDVDSIEGLSPAISIEQKTTNKNPRSTVGTVTEIYDYLRLLYAKIGVHHCPKCNSPIKPQTAENITSLIMALKGQSLVFLAPVVRGQKGTHEQVIDELRKQGFTKIRVDQRIYQSDTVLGEVKLARYEKHWVEAVIDTVKVAEEDRSRISEAVEQALLVGKGRMTVIGSKEGAGQRRELDRFAEEISYSTFGACPNHPEVIFEALEPRMFSFNSPFGACPACHGLGEITEISPDLLIPDRSKSVMDGAIEAYGKMELSWRAHQIAEAGKKHGFDVFTPIDRLSKRQLDVLLYGDRKEIGEGGRWKRYSGFEGVIPQTMRLYRETHSEWRREEIEKFMRSDPCTVCMGKKLQPVVLAVKVEGRSIIDVTDMSIDDSVEFFRSLPQKLQPKELAIATQVLKEINERLGFLRNVGLGYLTLSRSARTISGGEAQRIRLATQIGSNLMGVLYILDEPSIGLHQRDNKKLIHTLKGLRDIGNTLIVVEHDFDTIMAADHIVDIGPGAGVHGGHVVAEGTPKEIMNNDRSLTGRYLSGKLRIDVPASRRRPVDYMTISGARANNLKNLTVKLPLGVICGITGVSGSGKSTLMNQTVMPLLKKKFGEQAASPGAYTSFTVPDIVRNVIVIDQDPIGSTPSSAVSCTSLS